MLQTADHQAADCGVVLPRGKAQINHAALFRLPVDNSIEACPAVCIDLAIERKGLQVGHVACALGTDHEPEMMPIALAPASEGFLIGAIARGVEHSRLFPIPGHALPPQIGDVCGERCSAEGAASVTHDASL